MLTLNQNAYAGSAGNGSTPGTATSNFTLTQNGVSSLTVSTVAVGGYSDFITTEPAAQPYTQPGIPGGVANANTNLTSSTTGSIYAIAQATGGSSGTNSNTTTPQTEAPELTARRQRRLWEPPLRMSPLAPRLRGRRGGFYSSAPLIKFGGTGGAGGTSSAISTGVNGGAGSVTGYAYSTGGFGGIPFFNVPGSVGGNGGNATATATGISASGPVSLTASVQGGNAGLSLTPGIAGTATATATTHGVTVTDFIASGANPQTGGTANAGVSWSSAGGAIAFFGYSSGYNTNDGQGTVTGPAAQIYAIIGGGSLIVGDGVNGTALQIYQNAGVSYQSALTINAGSKLDLANDHFTINYGSGPSPNASIRGYLSSGYNAGGSLWTGTTGITSSSPRLIRTPFNRVRRWRRWSGDESSGRAIQFAPGGTLASGGDGHVRLRRRCQSGRQGGLRGFHRSLQSLRHRRHQLGPWQFQL